ncbi:hypothetical protein CQW23_14247 [Capsicum baccatum]|uniref:Uncharacterized protein n=1 Tax=Capsicum baccatum TaxID=33114 RepID=A0A2G2WIU1_CAPBA|nr:hypothetical protein CQW23_14247 [Capsicum baccatum]
MMPGLSFYPQPSPEDEILPWIQKHVTPVVVEPSTPTVEQQTPAQNPLEPIFVPIDLVDDMQEAGTMTSTHLGQVRLFLLKEHHARKINVNCPQNMFKCSVHLRPTLNPGVGKYAVIMSPSLRDRDSELACRANAQHRFYKPMNFIIWNYRGSISRDFRLASKELIANHKPALVVLLETHRKSHQSQPHEFSFSNVLAVPAEGRAGGMALLWPDDLISQMFL